MPSINTVLMAVLPAASAHQFWVHLGESLFQCEMRHRERRRPDPDGSGNQRPGASDFSGPTRDVLITASFDAGMVCVELSYVKEDGSRFTNGEIAALLGAKSAAGRRKWTKTSAEEWRSDDGFVAGLGQTRLARKQIYYWIHFRRVPPTMRDSPMLDKRLATPVISTRRSDASGTPAAPKPPASFRLKYLPVLP